MALCICNYQYDSSRWFGCPRCAGVKGIEDDPIGNCDDPRCDLCEPEPTTLNLASAPRDLTPSVSR